jgi:hypothetical protein
MKSEWVGIYLAYMAAGLAAVPFGVVYAMWRYHHGDPTLIIAICAAFCVHSAYRWAYQKVKD